jgi:predicted RecA/RadA family phage recombinase
LTGGKLTPPSVNYFPLSTFHFPFSKEQQMKNFIQHGGTLSIASAPYARLAGEGLQVGAALFGVCVDDVLITGECEIVTEGVFELPKDSSTFIQGDCAYWDDAAKAVTSDDLGNIAIGVAVLGAATGVATVQVKLGAPLTVLTT